jgi:exonuclease SbcD
MKIAHTGDLHWGLGYPGPSPDSRFNDICQVADFMADKIIEEKCDLVLVAGDLFKDARVFLDRASVEIAAAVKWLRRFSDAGIPVVVISGTPSHDAVAAYELIKEMRIRGVAIYTTPGVHEVLIEDNSLSIACLPGINRSTIASKEEFSKLPAHELHQLMTERVTQAVRGLEAECANDFKILMSHITTAAADKGFEDLIQQQEPVLTKDAIEGSGFGMVCLGHIHKPQMVEGVDVATFYCGAPERLSFNEEGHKPLFWIHNLTGGEPHSKYIETPARDYCTLQFDLHDKDTETFDRWCSFITGEKGVEYLIDREGSIVRMRYKVTEAQAKQINQAAIVKALHDAGAFYVQGIEAEVVRSTRTRAAEADAGMTPTEALAMWGRVNDVKDDELAELTTRAEVLHQGVGIGG